MLAGAVLPVSASRSPMPAHRLLTARSRTAGGAGPPTVRCGPSTDRDAGAVTGRARCTANASSQEVTGQPAQPSTSKAAAQKG